LVSPSRLSHLQHLRFNCQCRGNLLLKQSVTA
jgi:hypothetical protein